MQKKTSPSNLRKPNRAQRSSPKPASAQAASLAVKLERLARDLATVPAPSPRRNLAHDECEATLEFYVESERSGEPVQAIYPLVWKHLQSCKRCELSYALLKESPSAAIAESSLQPGLATPLPFLNPSTHENRWIKRIRSRIGGAPLAFSFTLSPQRLLNFFAVGQPALLTRDQAPAPKKSLALFDTVVLGRQEIDVEVWTERLADQVQLGVSLASPNPLPEPFRVTIKWDDHFLSDLIHDGQLTFAAIPIVDLERARDLNLEFESAAQDIPPEEQHASNR